MGEREEPFSQTAPKIAIHAAQGLLTTSMSPQTGSSSVSYLHLQEDITRRGSGLALIHPWERYRGSSSTCARCRWSSRDMRVCRLIANWMGSLLPSYPQSGHSAGSLGWGHVGRDVSGTSRSVIPSLSVSSSESWTLSSHMVFDLSSTCSHLQAPILDWTLARALVSPPWSPVCNTRPPILLLVPPRGSPFPVSSLILVLGSLYSLSHQISPALMTPLLL